jgi:gluconokinase
MIIIVMGVSGSGKTVVGEALAARLIWAFEDADNWHPASKIEKMHRGAALTDDDRLPWIRSLSSAVQKWIGHQRDVVLACSALRECYRNALREGSNGWAVMARTVHSQPEFRYLKEHTA